MILTLAGMREAFKLLLLKKNMISVELAAVEEWTVEHVKALSYYLKEHVMSRGVVEPGSEVAVESRMAADAHWQEAVAKVKETSTNAEHFVQTEVKVEVAKVEEVVAKVEDTVKEKIVEAEEKIEEVVAKTEATATPIIAEVKAEVETTAVKIEAAATTAEAVVESTVLTVEAEAKVAEVVAEVISTVEKAKTE